MKVTQRVFKGLQKRASGEKTDFESASRALNVDLFRELVEPRKGRTSLLSAPLGAPGIYFSGYSDMVIVPANAAWQVTNAMTFTCLLRPKIAMRTVPTGAARFIIATNHVGGYDNTGGSVPQTTGWVLMIEANGAGAWDLVFQATTTAGVRRVSISLDTGTTLVDGDELRIYAGALLGTTMTLEVGFWKNGTTGATPPAYTITAFGDETIVTDASAEILIGGGLDSHSNRKTSCHYFGSISDIRLYTGFYYGKGHAAIQDFLWRVPDPSLVMTYLSLFLRCDECRGWALANSGTAAVSPYLYPRPVVSTGSEIVFEPGTSVEVDCRDIEFESRVWACMVTLRALPSGGGGVIIGGQLWQLRWFDDTGVLAIQLRTRTKDGAWLVASESSLAFNTQYRIAAVFDTTPAAENFFLFRKVGATWTQIATSVLTLPIELGILTWGGYPSFGCPSNGNVYTDELRIGWVDTINAAGLTALAATVPPKSKGLIALYTPASYVAFEDYATYADVGVSIDYLKDVGGSARRAYAWPNAAMTRWTALVYLMPYRNQRVRAIEVYRSSDGVDAFRYLGSSDVFDASGIPTRLPGVCEDGWVDRSIISRERLKRIYFLGVRGRSKYNGTQLDAIGYEQPYVGYYARTGITTKGELEKSHTYALRFTLYNSSTGQESNPTDPIEVTSGVNDIAIDLTVQVQGARSVDWDSVRIYRKSQDSERYYLEVTKLRDSPAATNDIEAAIYGVSPISAIRISMSEADLAEQPELETDNDPPPRHRTGEFHYDRLYLVGEEYPDRVYYSKEHRIESFPALSVFPVGQGDNDSIQALVTTPYGLLILKTNSTWVLPRGSEDEPRAELLSAAYGCASAATVLRTEKAWLWLSPKGIVIFDGSTPQEASMDIRGYFNEADTSKFPTAIAGLLPQQNQAWFLIGDDLLVYDLIGGRWMQGRIGAFSLATLKDPTTRAINLYSGYWGQVFQWHPTAVLDGSVNVANSTYSGIVPLASWITAGGQIIGITITSGSLYAVGYGIRGIPVTIVLGANGYKSADPVYVRSVVYNTTTKMYFSETIAPGAATTLSWYLGIIPMIYETQDLVFSGPDSLRRLKYLKLYLPRDGVNGSMPFEVDLLYDGTTPTANGKTWNLLVSGLASAHELTIGLGQFARTVRARIATASHIGKLSVDAISWKYLTRDKE